MGIAGHRAATPDGWRQPAVGHSQQAAAQAAVAKRQISRPGVGRRRRRQRARHWRADVRSGALPAAARRPRRSAGSGQPAHQRTSRPGHRQGSRTAQRRGRCTQHHQRLVRAPLPRGACGRSRRTRRRWRGGSVGRNLSRRERNTGHAHGARTGVFELLPPGGTGRLDCTGAIRPRQLRRQHCRSPDRRGRTLRHSGGLGRGRWAGRDLRHHLLSGAAARRAFHRCRRCSPHGRLERQQAGQYLGGLPMLWGSGLDLEPCRHRHPAPDRPAGR